MTSLKDIKNKALREFLNTYSHFTELSDHEKEQYLKKIIDLPEEKQKKVLEFLQIENEKAKIKALSDFYVKVREMGDKLLKISLQQKESQQSAHEEEYLSEILNKINN